MAMNATNTDVLQVVKFDCQPWIYLEEIKLQYSFINSRTLNAILLHHSMQAGWGDALHCAQSIKKGSQIKNSAFETVLSICLVTATLQKHEVWTCTSPHSRDYISLTGGHARSLDKSWGQLGVAKDGRALKPSFLLCRSLHNGKLRIYSCGDPVPTESLK